MEGTRERRRRMTAFELERVAIDLFAERGFDSVTVDEIAAAAHISRRTFFRYYPSKEDVVLAAGDKALARLRAGLAALARRAGTGGPTQHRARDVQRVRDGSGGVRPALGDHHRLPHARRAYGLQWDWDETISDYVAQRLGLDPDKDLRPR